MKWLFYAIYQTLSHEVKVVIGMLRLYEIDGTVKAVTEGAV
jgi:hypothetical protein